MTPRDTKMLLEDAVRMQASKAVFGGVAYRRTELDLALRRVKRAVLQEAASYLRPLARLFC